LYSTTPLGLGELAVSNRDGAMAILRDNPKRRSARYFSAADLGGLPAAAVFARQHFQQRSSYSIVMRVIPFETPTLDSLNLSRNTRCADCATASC